MAQSIKRSYWWRLLIFDESINPDWFRILKDSFADVAFAHHDRDIWDSDVIENEVVIHEKGSPKKSHRHFLIHYPVAKSYKQILELASSLCLQGKDIKYVMTADYPRKAYEYLWHANDKDKFQYGADIVNFVGCSADAFRELMFTSNHSGDTQLFRELLQFISDMDISEMCDVVDTVLAHGRDDFLELLQGRSSYLLDSYLRSKRLKAVRNLE